MISLMIEFYSTVRDGGGKYNVTGPKLEQNPHKKERIKNVY